MIKFQRQHIHSSMITSVAYDAFTQILEVVFCKGGIYEYIQVSEDEYQNLLNAESVGMYFNSAIRPKIHYLKVRN